MAAAVAARPDKAELSVSPPEVFQPKMATTSATTSWTADDGCQEVVQALKEEVLLPLVYPLVLATQNAPRTKRVLLHCPQRH